MRIGCSETSAFQPSVGAIPSEAGISVALPSPKRRAPEAMNLAAQGIANLRRKDSVAVGS